jgi:hypothetical protein
MAFFACRFVKLKIDEAIFFLIISAQLYILKPIMYSSSFYGADYVRGNCHLRDHGFN